MADTQDAKFSSKFYNSFKMIFALSKMSTFSLRPNGIEKNKYRWIRNVATISIYSALACICYKIINPQDSAVLVTTSKLIIFGSSAAFVAVLMVSGIACRNRRIELIVGLNELQTKFEELYGKVDHSELKSFVKIHLLTQCIATVLIVFVCYFFFRQEPNFLQKTIVSIVILYPIILSVFLTAEVSSSIYFVKTGFRLMNKEISQMANSTLDMPNFGGRRKRPANTIMVLNKFCDIHHHLIGLISSTNEAYGVDMLAICFFTFSKLIVGIYYVPYWKVVGWKRVLIGVYEAFWVAANVTVICNSCHDTLTEANKTGILLFNIDTDDPELENEIDIFTLQVANEKVEFNAAGFFSINYKLLFTIFGGVATYIIILIQLSNNK